MASQAKVVELVKPAPKPRRSRDGMDPETRTLRRVLLEQDRIQEKLRINNLELKAALRKWSDTRPGERGGIATEAGARFLLSRAGLLK